MGTFKSASGSSGIEREQRKDGRLNLRKFGIPYLDDAMVGIKMDDLVLIGAPSGVGKTQLCCHIALANMAEGKKVHFLALEAGEFEIERRLKYQIVTEMYFSNPKRKPVGGPLTYDRWVVGDYLEPMKEYEDAAHEFFEKCYKDLFIYYKQDKFGLTELIESVLSVADESDLFIIDHVHYFDLDDDNENRAIKQIAKTVRQLAIDEKRPIILVAHLRKRDRANEDLVAGLDEFHGSSDLTKIATKVVTVSSGGRTADGCYETFFRIPKNRDNNGPTRFIGRVIFDPKRNAYEKEYKIGTSSLTRKTGFEELDRDLRPEWAESKF